MSISSILGRPVACLFVAALLSGCAMQGGREFDTGYVAQIQRGVTTKTDVRQHLGEPVSVTTAGNGEDVWSYAHQKGPNQMQAVLGAYTGKVPMSMQSLTIIFTGDTVKDYTFSTSGNAQ